MTAPSPATLERETPQHETHYVTDAELIRRLRVPARELKRVLPELEAKHGFPRKTALFGNRRYWPAVKSWLDKYHGLSPQERRSA